MTETTDKSHADVETSEQAQTAWVPMPWRGQMVTMRQGPTEPDVFSRAIDKMIESDINLLVVEVEKGLQYDSHPQVSAEWALPKETLTDLINKARRGGLECVPLLPSLPHTGYLTEAYPQIAETACVCPRQARTQRILDELSAELIELFEPSLFHIGHDEMLSSFVPHQRRSVLQCPLCRGDDGAKWFLDSILRRHEYLTAQGIGTMMWADMLLDPEDFLHSSPWQGAMHAYHAGAPDHFERALEEIPRDIVMCDWHYTPSCHYQSVRYLQDKGFDVLGCPKTRNENNAFLFTRYAQRTRTPNLLGMMGTNWDEINSENASRLIQDAAENGAIFGGQDDPALRQKAAAAESRRFGEGAFEHVVDFVGDDCAQLEAAWSDQFGQNAFSTVGLGLSSGRKGKMCLSVLGLPNVMFERLEIELTPAGEFPGPGRTGVSVDGGKTYIYKPLQKHTDWTDVVKGYSRVFWRFEICNQRERKEGEPVKIGYRNCLNTVTVRGDLVKHR